MTASRILRGPGIVVRAGRSAWITPETIYGTILTGAVLAIAEENTTDGELLVNVASASLVFWLAHVFSTVVARHGGAHGRQPLRAATRHAAFHSAGFLLGPVIPIALLVPGALGFFDDELAYLAASCSVILVLATLGTIAAGERGARWYIRALAGLATGAVGLFVVVLKAVFH